MILSSTYEIVSLSFAILFPSQNPRYDDSKAFPAFLCLLFAWYTIVLSIYFQFTLFYIENAGFIDSIYFRLATTNFRLFSAF
jgi:hypothetical protein